MFKLSRIGLQRPPSSSSMRQPFPHDRPTGAVTGPCPGSHIEKKMGLPVALSASRWTGYGPSGLPHESSLTYETFQATHVSASSAS